jgi:hypothetical protein
MRFLSQQISTKFTNILFIRNQYKIIAKKALETYNKGSNVVVSNIVPETTGREFAAKNNSSTTEERSTTANHHCKNC